MAIHNLLGKEGEDAAADYLEKMGYRVRHRNWRSGHKELDIVAVKDGMLVVVEVKTRRNQQFGRPEAAVTPLKERRIVTSADAYVRKFGIDLPVRFDIIELTGEEAPFRIDHIQDAFFPTMG